MAHARLCRGGKREEKKNNARDSSDGSPRAAAEQLPSLLKINSTRTSFFLYALFTPHPLYRRSFFLFFFFFFVCDCRHWPSAATKILTLRCHHFLSLLVVAGHRGVACKRKLTYLGTPCRCSSLVLLRSFHSAVRSFSAILPFPRVAPVGTFLFPLSCCLSGSAGPRGGSGFLRARIICTPRDKKARGEKGERSARRWSI